MVTLYVVVLCIVLQLGPTPDPKIITCYGNWAMQHFRYSICICCLGSNDPATVAISMYINTYTL